jgi:hypothetical protein
MIRLRKYPFPFSAALAICSDPDSTRDIEAYMKFHERLGRMGLEISDGLFLQSASLVSFLDASGRVDPRIAGMARLGQVDTVHSFAELNEEDAGCGALTRGLEGLTSQDVPVEIWSNHSRSRFNLLSGEGDVRGSRYYHADRLSACGVRFIWAGGITPIWGQDSPVGPAQLLDVLRHPAGTDRIVLRSLLGILAKLILSHCCPGLAAYRGNRLLRPVTARDGTRFWSFMRYGRRLARDDRFMHLADILSGERLDALIRRNAAAIVYTHFGKSNGALSFTSGQCVSRIFAPLARRSCRIWVSPTSRLLRYMVTRDHLDWALDGAAGELSIRGISDPVTGRREATPRDVEGITFCSDRCDLTFKLPPGARAERFSQPGLTSYVLRGGPATVRCI